MAGLPIRVCRVETAEGLTDYVTCLPDADVFREGLIPEAIIGVLRRPIRQGEPITPDIFSRNSVFVDFMHEVIARRGPTLRTLVTEAARQREGLVIVIDQRTPTPQGSVPPEDIVGAFEVHAGKCVPGSYKPNRNHAILSLNGFVRLGAELQECLLEELAKRRQVPDSTDDR